MYFIIIVLLSMIAGISAILLLLTRNEINNIAKSLEKINSVDTNRKITLSFSNKSLRNLVKQINRNITRMHATRVEYKSMDTELRRAIANISHDLRTPLTSIIGYIELIKDEKSSKEEKNSYADIILSRAKSLKMLISEFFDLSRLQANEYNFEFKPISLSNILCELMASFYNDFIDKNIEPIINIDETAPQIIADENAVNRIFTNLIQNALKHGSNFISVSLEKKGNYIVTKFINDAPNLNKHDVGHIFERFFTGDKMRTDKNTGLGLAITKSLVEQMSSSITASLSNGKLIIIINWKI